MADVDRQLIDSDRKGLPMRDFPWYFHTIAALYIAVYVTVDIATDTSRWYLPIMLGLLVASYAVLYHVAHLTVREADDLIDAYQDHIKALGEMADLDRQLIDSYADLVRRMKEDRS